jgi:hypothetical protein
VNSLPPPWQPWFVGKVSSHERKRREYQDLRNTSTLGVLESFSTSDTAFFISFLGCNITKSNHKG